VGAIWHEVGVRDGLGLSPRWLSWACPGHQLESRISRQREISVPSPVSRDESRAGARVARDLFRLRRACDAALWPQIPALWISGPHTPTGADSGRATQKKAARRTSPSSLAAANARQRRSKRAQPTCAIHRPPAANGLDRYHRAELQHRSQLLWSVDQEIALFLRVLRMLPRQD
jgi:hypothetical protein